MYRKPVTAKCGEVSAPWAFVRFCFVPGTVLVARDTDNMSHLLSIDGASAITTLTFIDKTES